MDIELDCKEVSMEQTEKACADLMAEVVPVVKAAMEQEATSLSTRLYLTYNLMGQLGYSVAVTVAALNMFNETYDEKETANEH